MVRLKPVGHTVSDIKYGDCKEIEKFVRKRQKQFKSVFFLTAINMRRPIIQQQL